MAEAKVFQAKIGEITESQRGGYAGVTVYFDKPGTDEPIAMTREGNPVSDFLFDNKYGAELIKKIRDAGIGAVVTVTKEQRGKYWNITDIQHNSASSLPSAPVPPEQPGQAEVTQEKRVDAHPVEATKFDDERWHNNNAISMAIDLFKAAAQHTKLFSAPKMSAEVINEYILSTATSFLKFSSGEHTVLESEDKDLDPKGVDPEELELYW